MYLKRTVVLSETNSGTKILLVVEKSERIVARIKGLTKMEDVWAVFSFNNAPLFLSRAEIEEGEFVVNLPQYTNINEKVCCAVFSTKENQITYYGGTEGKENFYGEFLKNLPEFNRQIKCILKEEQDKLFEQSDDEIEKEIDNEITNQLVYECLNKCEDDKCKECIYKKAFFEKQQSNETVLCNLQQDENFEQKKEETVKTNKPFYYAVEGSLTELFSSYPNDETLEKLITNSKFAKVDYEGDGNFYSVGVIYNEQGEEKYICYAIFGSKDVPPPSELNDFSQYLPVDEENGYYLMYQNAENGENIVINN